MDILLQENSTEYSVKTTTTAHDIALLFVDDVLPTDREYKKDFQHLLKLLSNKYSIEIDIHTSGERRRELFLDKKSNSYIIGMLEFIDRKLDSILDPLGQIPKHHTDSYIKKYEECIVKQEQYEYMKQEIVKYYDIKR